MDLTEIGYELHSSGSGWGPVAGYCDHGSETSASKESYNKIGNGMDSNLMELSPS
jgi:hypothetical protein